MIRTKNLYLRPVTSEDLPSLHQQIQAIDYPFWPTPLTPFSHFKNNFEKNGAWSENFSRLLICDHDQKVIGLINWFKTAPYSDALELGYLIFDQKNHNKGYMHESLTAAVNYIFENHRVNRLQVAITTGNENSLALAKKVGFVSEGILRQFFMLKGKDVDVEILSLLRHEWLKRVS